MKVLKEVWSIEVFNGKRWLKQLRYFSEVKDKTDIDLIDIEGCQRNAKFLGLVPIRQSI